MSTKPRTGIKDYTGDGNAENRAFHINLGFFKYGTDDKVHGAAMVFSIILLLIIVGVIGFGDGSAWGVKIFNWVSGAFLFTAGIALGKGVSDNKKEH